MSIGDKVQKAGLALAMLLLCGLLLIPRMAMASDVPVASEKNETVYIHTAPDGTVLDVEVSTVLKNPDAATELSDSSNLTDFDVVDDKTFTGSGDSMVWLADGDNVEYTGKSSKAAPVSIKVSYTLDGQAISPEQLAGKSGKVTIRYEYVNSSTVTATINGVSQTIYTPFTCVTTVMMNGDDFKNITVENAKIIEDGNDTIVVGYAMPGLKQSLGSMADEADVPDHFTVTADVTNLELKSTMTIATAGLMSDFDTESLGISGLGDASELIDAMDLLIDGSSTLTDGLDEIASGASKLENGASSLIALSSGIASGLSALNSESGLYGIEQGADSLEQGIGTISSAVSDAKAQLELLETALAGYTGQSSEYTDALALLSSYEGTIDPEDYQRLQSALLKGAEASVAIDCAVEGLDSAVTSIDSLVDALDDAMTGANGIKQGLEVATSSVGKLESYAWVLDSGLSELSSSIPALEEALQAATDGSKTLTEGMQTFNDEGISRLVNTLNNDYGGLLDRMNALSDAAKAYDNFGGITPGTTGSVKFIFETDGISKE